MMPDARNSSIVKIFVPVLSATAKDVTPNLLITSKNLKRLYRTSRTLSKSKDIIVRGSITNLCAFIELIASFSSLVNQGRSIFYCCNAS